MKKTSQLAKKVFVMLDKNKVNYCVLRNYQFLLEEKTDELKDIDALVLKKDLGKIDSILKNQGFSTVPINPFSMHRGYAKFVKEDGKLLQFHFHVNGVTGRHVKYLDAERILSRKERRKYIYVPSNEDLFLIILMHNLLDLNRFKERYKKELSNLSRTRMDTLYIANEIRRIFTQEQSEKILALIERNDFKNLEKLMPNLKKQFERKRIFRIWLGVYLRGALWKLPYLIKRAPLISLIGMDGTGKTTTTRNLEKIFEENKIRYSSIYTGRGRYNILPIQFFGKPYKKLEKKTDEKNKERKTSLFKKIIYSAAAPVFVLDLILRYLFRIMPKRRTKQVVITDRYSTDILLMANVPMLIKKILYLFFPKPTLTIYLWNKPEILHKRKPDHLLDDLKRQERIFSEIKVRIKPLAIKSEGIDKTTQEVAEAIFSQIY